MGEKTDEAFRPLPLHDRERGGQFAQEFLEKLEELDHDLASQLASNSKAMAFLQAVFVDVPFVRDCAFSNPDVAAQFLCDPSSDHLENVLLGAASLLTPQTTEKDLSRDLRKAKQKVALLTALADLGDFMSMSEVTRVLARFADLALTLAVRFSLIQEQARGKLRELDLEEPERGTGLILLAMGKHGSFELNYSSDIDLIAFFDPLAQSQTNAFDVQEAMIRVMKRVVRLIQERTEHGYVFRTDLRLRPDPGATPIVISVDAALNYYESIGQNWERAAYIKARPVACDEEAALGFLKNLTPFVWRKYMDFATIAEVHAMKRQMHQHKGHAEIALRGHNVKLGRGGIREIEFFVQTQQLIAGGRNSALRERDTLTILKLLAQEGWIDPSVSEQLSEAYIFLRNVEHRIQMRHDEQSHLMPKDEEAMAAIARLCGFVQLSDFEQRLNDCLHLVSKHYAELFEDHFDTDVVDALNFTAQEDDPDTLAHLQTLGFQQVEQVNNVIRGWHSGRYRAMRSDRARDALTMILPRLLSAFSNTDQADNALFLFDDFLKNLPAGVQLFSLLAANHQLLDILAQIMGSAPRLSTIIARRPHVFDALLEPAFFGEVPTYQQLCQQLEASFDQALDYQDILDRTRIFAQEQKFLIGTRLLSGTVSVPQSQRMYSDLVDAVVANLLPKVVDEVAINHGRVAGADMAVVALGRLGSREMSPDSDLDLILIYELAEGVQESDGKRPLAVSQYFARITQRFIAALSAPTGEGTAYEVDMRLRPSGKAGPLATAFESFAKYQQESAWTWEHMALTRARVLCGSAVLQANIKEVIRGTLTSDRREEKLRADVLEMNTLLHESKTESGALDIKLMPGGLVDLEFIVQFLQLRDGSAKADILSSNTLDVLDKLEAVGGDLTEEDVLEMKTAYGLYSSLLQYLRLCVLGRADIDDLPRALAHRLCSIADVPDIARLKTQLGDTSSRVLQIFQRLTKV